ncbi:hypothetical protein BaRGS_00007791 [Batillaria attramentaria]|uniref:Uncharacterized protein n=1 Tax=Batillaria attramentaria TaxID=370345 RepID=A0ABD0LNQ0_9CAEN
MQMFLMNKEREGVWGWGGHRPQVLTHLELVSVHAPVHLTSRKARQLTKLAVHLAVLKLHVTARVEVSPRTRATSPPHFTEDGSQGVCSAVLVPVLTVLPVIRLLSGRPGSAPYGNGAHLRNVLIAGENPPAVALVAPVILAECDDEVVRAGWLIGDIVDRSYALSHLGRHLHERCHSTRLEHQGKNAA